MNWVGEKATALSGMLTKLTTLFSSRKIQDQLELDEQEEFDLDKCQDYYTYSLSSSGMYDTTITTPTITASGVFNTSGSYSIPTGGLWTSPYTTFSVGNSTTVDNDITLCRQGKPNMKIGATLDEILKQLLIIVPDHKLLEENESLKLAYDNYVEVLQATVNPELSAAYNSYKIIERLTTNDEEE